MKFYHSSYLLVHLDTKRLYSILSYRFYWMGMHQDVGNYCAACLKCIKHKSGKPLSNGLLIPIITTQPSVCIDIKGPQKTIPEGHTYILVCIDHFTNWVEAAPLKAITAKEVIEKLFNLIISRHSCPKKVMSDQGTQFTSGAFKNLCKYYNMGKVESVANHQQTNGKAKKFGLFFVLRLTLLQCFKLD